MTIATNTSTTYNVKGIREQLAEFISNIAPVDVVFSNLCGKMTAESTFVEWQTDSLATASTTNQQLEGDDISTFQTTTATVRIGNRTEIAYKTVVVAGTADAVNKAGRKNELAYQLTKKTKELKRDIEASITANKASAAGNATTARTTGGLRAWLATNTSTGSGGSNGGYSSPTVAAATDGTQRAFNEGLLKTVLASVFTNGGDPDTLMVGPFNRQVVSSFTGNATRFKEAEDKTLMASISIYESDYGSLKVVPNRFQRDRDAFVLQSDLWKLAWLRPVQVSDLAKTGDASKKLLVGEYALVSINEAGSGVCADLTTS